MSAVARRYVDDDLGAVITFSEREVRPAQGSSLQRSAAASTSREVIPATIPAYRWAAGSRHLGTTALQQRLHALESLSPGWDSHGGRPVGDAAVLHAFAFLVHFDDYIQSAPSVSATPAGGVECRWSRGHVLLEVEFDEEESLVFFRNGIMEWEGTLSQATPLEKWLWQASATD